MFKIQIILVVNTCFPYSVNVHLHFNNIAKQGKIDMFLGYHKYIQCILPTF